MHLLGRYREFRTSGVAVERAIEQAWDRTGPPCLTAALTSAAGFVALAAADFRGFSQLGWLLAIGLLVCLALMLTTLPLLLAALDRNPTQLLGAQPDAGKESNSSYRLAPVGLGVAAILTVILGLWVSPLLSWEYDFSALRRDGLAYAELSEVERQLARESYSPVIVSLPDRATLEAAQQRADTAIAEGRLPHVKQAVSLASVLPPDQQARVEAITALKKTLSNPNLRYLPPELVKNLLPLKDVDPKVMSDSDLPAPVGDVLGVGHHRLLLFPQGNMWDLREAAKLKSELERVFPDEPVAGEYVALGSLFEVVQRDMPWVAAFALLFVTILTALDLRRAHWVAGALFTLLGGITWAAAATHVAGVKLSVINVVGVPILLGIGVDMVIHLLHRLREEGPGGVRRALATTGVAALLSTLTTVLSFASLTLAGNRGVRSLGLLVVIGLIAVFTATATLLPLAWSAGWRVTGRAPADQPTR